MDLKAVVPHVFKVNPAAVKSVTVTPDSSGAPVVLVPVPGPPGPQGLSILAGSGIPTNEKSVGTLYIDTTTGDLYRFES